MRTIEVAVAGEVAELLQHLKAGEEVVLTEHHVPVARVVRFPPARSKRQFGIAKGQLQVHDDFDAPLADFEAYTR